MFQPLPPTDARWVYDDPSGLPDRPHPVFALPLARRRRKPAVRVVRPAVTTPKAA